MKVIVTSGHNRSLGTIGLLEILKNDGHEITKVFVVRAFQINRSIAYLRQFGLPTIVAKYKSHYLRRGRTYLDQETRPLKAYIKSRNITENSVSQYCANHSIAICHVNSLSTKRVLQSCRDINPDIIAYSGGGILCNNLIETAKKGVINAHSGPLPEIRGMNAIEWSIIRGLQPTTTIHMIDAGIDTGKVLYSENIPTSPGDNIYDFRGRTAVQNIHLMSKVLGSFESFEDTAENQDLSAGRQYFVMHKKIKQLLTVQSPYRGDDKYSL